MNNTSEAKYCGSCLHENKKITEEPCFNCIAYLKWEPQEAEKETKKNG